MMLARPPGQFPLRVLHISSLYPPQVVGGAEKVVELIAEAQAASGMDVGAAYLVRSPQPAGERKGVKTFPQTGRNLIWIEDVMRRRRLMRTASKLLQMINLQGAEDFARIVEIFRPDIVHTHSMVDLPPQIWSRAKTGGVKIVHTLHDYDLVCSRASLFRNGRNCTMLHPSCRALLSWKGHFAQYIDAVSAVSHPVLDMHQAHGQFAHLPSDRARVIWNAVPTSDAIPPRQPLPKETPMTFGFLGRLVPEKGIEVLLRACRLLPDNGWRLRIAGHSPDGDAAFRALAEGLPVEFVGFVEPAGFLDSLDVLVVPSIWREPFGLTVVEAFARGVPVLGANHGAIADLVGRVGVEWLTEPNNAHALAKRMAAIIADGRASLPAGDRFSPILEAVSLPRVLADYDELYRQVLDRAHVA